MTKLERILYAREQRVMKQQELLKKYKHTLICFTMNIPGEDKDSSLIRLAFSRGCDMLRENLGEILCSHVQFTDAGPEAYFVTSLAPEDVKNVTIALETSFPAGRLFDMDVLAADGSKLSRRQRRSCFICGGPAEQCAKSGKHTIEQAREKADEMLQDFAAEFLAEMAVDSLLEEVRLTPKPGLVDRDNSGSHTDMDVSLFEKSAEALRPYFTTAVMLGLENKNCMEQLQDAGMEAENAMYAVTNGINTHKGAIYAFGLMLAAIGAHISFGCEIFSTAASLASQGKSSQEHTHGSLVRMKFRKCGARQEAEEGFPNALSAYKVLCETENPYRALLWLMASVQDTNVLYRGGADGLAFVQEFAKMTQELNDKHLLDGLRKMDHLLIEKKLSPGGCADLLALSLFLRKTEMIWNED